MATKQRSRRKALKTRTPPRVPEKFIDLDITDTPEFLALAGIEPRLYDAESIILGSRPNRDSEPRVHVVGGTSVLGVDRPRLAPPKKPARKRSIGRKPPPS
jgi:hypothetical protein